MKKIFIGLVLLLLNWLDAPFAHSSDSLTKLASIHDFAFGGVGVAGSTSQGELAFRDILAGPTAEKDFLNLLESGNAQARCYALVGLRSVSPKIYSIQVKRFAQDKIKVSVIQGCMITEEEMSSIVANIEAGRYDGYIKKK